MSVLSSKYKEKEGLECLGEDVSTRRIDGRSKETFDDSIVKQLLCLAAGFSQFLSDKQQVKGISRQ